MLHEFIIEVPYNNVDKVIDDFNAAGIYYLYYESPIEIVKVPNGYDYEENTDENIELKIYAGDEEISGLPESYLDLISKTLGISKDSISHQVSDAGGDYDSDFDNVDLGNGWMIQYPGSDVEQDMNVLKFDPQAAFGTGLHETTQDCLRILLNQDLAGKTLLDLGTGSGMLSIAAGLKGADKIIAIDYEPVEREVRLNAELNDINEGLEVVQADLISGDYQIKENYDWILINIGADETVKIINKHELLKKSRNFIISGMVEWHLDEVKQTFDQAGFEVKETKQTNEWVTILFGL